MFAALEPGNSAALVVRLKRRDTSALDELYTAYGRLVYSLILRIVRDAGTAEDLTQETFLRIWNRVAAFQDERGQLGPWVMAIARNRAIDYLRSVQGRASLTSVEIHASEHPSLFVTMEEDLLNSERGRKLKAAFEHLNENHRLVIELAYYEGLSQTEMAEKLNQPLGTIKTWTRMALKTLRESIGVEIL